MFLMYKNKITVTFLSCLTLYLRTKNQLQIQEKIFLNEYKQPRIINIQKIKEKKITKESLSGSLI